MTQMLRHGGDIYGVSLKTGIPVKEYMDFSANINPLGIPESVKQAMEAAIENSVHYPDPLCRELTQALGKKLQVPPENILCGNGGADILYRIVYASKPRKAMVPAPTFLDYEEALAQTGTTVFTYPLGEDMEVKMDILEHICKDTDIIFLCTPNNPTGLLISNEILDAILKKAEQVGSQVVVDECFLDFVKDGQIRSVAGVTATCKNLIVVKSFTKLYAIPGVRLGYGICSDLVFLQKMRKAGQVWPVNSIALAAGLAALTEDGFVRETIKYIEKERKWLFDQLKMLGLQVYPGQADYLLFRAPGHKDLYEKMLKERIIIRRCRNYKNLTEEHYRVAVKDHESNESLIRGLRHCLKAL